MSVKAMNPMNPKRAFLAASVLAIVAGAPARGETPAQTIVQRMEPCFACHGRNGQSTTPLTPSLGAQPSFFALAQLFLFREGQRTNEIMAPNAKGLSDDDMRALADEIAKLPAPPAPSDGRDPVRFARGEAIASQNHCTSCHNPDFSGRDQMPRLRNQREDYLLKALRDFKSGKRVGYGMPVMADAVAVLKDSDLADLAHFLAYQP